MLPLGASGVNDDALVSVTESAGLSAAPMETAIQLLDGEYSASATLGVVAQAVTHADRALTLAVRQARAQGRTWRDIGHLLGMSPQAAHQRFSKLM